MRVDYRYVHSTVIVVSRHKKVPFYSEPKMGLEPLDEHVLTEQEVPQITTYLSITKGNKLISSRERGTNR